MNDFVDALHQALEVFDSLHVPYAVLGGIAVRAYGIPRATYDVDFAAAIPRGDLPKFYTAVEDAGFTVPEAYRGGWVDNVAGMPLVKFRLYLAGRGTDVDVFLAESQFLQSVLSRRRQVVVDDVPLWLVSPEDLILLKLMANRPRDIGDVGDVFFMQGQMDFAYLRRWADALGVRERLDGEAAKHGF